MEPTSVNDRQSAPEPARGILADRFQALKSAELGLRIRDAALKLGCSEMDLVALSLGGSVTRLDGPWSGLLAGLPNLGTVMALTRNEHAVHEKIGVYDKISVDGAVGLVLGEDIDLRLFLGHWRHGFAVREIAGELVRDSLQFFDAHGDAVHKVYLRPDSDAGAYRNLVARFRHAAQTPAATAARPVPTAPLADSAVDVEAYRAAWDGLKDTHEFFGMLKAHKLQRVQGLRLAGAIRARRVASSALRLTLERAAEDAMPVMVFVGNPGCIQIHTGPIQALKEVGPWFNVLDPGFNLHLREPAIASAWVVTKPTTDGVVTSLELFDAAEKNIALLFGKRKPGRPEDAAWRRLAKDLPGA